jgi:cyclopropane-fatty-acyl-phospholipid synthase
MTDARRHASARFPFDALIDRAASRVAVDAVTRIRVGGLTVRAPDGTQRRFGDPAGTPQAELHLHHPSALRKLLLEGEVGGGDAYVEGLWSSPDLVALLSLAAMNREALRLSAGWWRRPTALMRTLAHRRDRNTRAGSRRNIEAHYDLGNEFYRLWLDETMTYSSALFISDEASLADAQRAKYDRMAELAGVGPGKHVLEIGTGWGGFALHIARRFDCRVTTITISPAQQRLAQDQVRAAGLADRVDVRLCDYRDIEGRYDAIVSIEMLEAVGAEYLATFFAACDRALAPGGSLAIQVITFPNDAYEAQLRGANWIQRRIFPGGVLPSLAAIERALAGTRLLLTSTTDIRASYARTLMAWRTRFRDQLPAVRALGFDDRFVRRWEYYLAISEAGFRTGLAQDLQLGFEQRRGMQ